MKKSCCVYLRECEEWKRSWPLCKRNIYLDDMSIYTISHNTSVHLLFCSLLPPHSVVSVLLIRCEWDAMSTKETLQKLLLISYHGKYYQLQTKRSTLLASLRSSSLPRLVAGNVKYFCLLKINVDSPSDICFSRLLWTWPRNLMQELSILYLYNILLI